MWGAAHSNYAGRLGLDLNPAVLVDAPYRWELHVLSLDAALLNNYMYLASNSRLIRNGVQGEGVSEEKITDRYVDRPSKFGYGSVLLNLPSFIYSGDKWGAAFHARTRVEFSGSNIPNPLAKYFKEGFDYNPQQNTRYSVRNAKAAFAAWHEFGVTFGHVLHDSKEHYWSAAATVNYNYGLNGFFLLLDQADYFVPADTLLVIENMIASYGHALPNNGKGSSSNPLARRGSGFGTTVGVQYFRNRNDAFFDPCKRGKGQKPYDYRVGLSVMDIGYVKFNNGARTYKINDRDANWFGIDTTTFNGWVYTDSLVGANFYGRRLGARDAFSFSVYLPTAASIQFDYAFTEYLFLNATVIQRVPLSKYAIRRSSQIAITPRFESRRLEFSLPVSFYERFRPRLGMALRFGSFTIGTDMISPLLGFTDSYGANLFFGIAVRNFGGCGKAKNRGTIRSIEQCIDR